MASKKRKTREIPTLVRGQASSGAKPLDPFAGSRPSHVDAPPVLPTNSPGPATGEAEETDGSPQKKPKVNNTIRPNERMRQFLRDWAQKAQKTLLRREAGPDYSPSCGSCTAALSESQSVYRCFDCLHAPTECQQCVVKNHVRNPFHRVEEWDPAVRFWQRRSLYDLGLVVSLGHGGSPCAASPPPRKMTIVHQHGVQTMALKFCHCTADGTLVPDPLQLLAFGLFPGSWDIPTTAYSINGLRDYHLLSLQTQMTAMDYVTYLRRSTDAVHPGGTKDRERELNTTMREFTFLRTTRRMGQEPVQGLPAGSLAVLCPCCPQPDKNMAPGWAERADQDAYLETLFYSIDGNFHQNQKLKPMDPDDFPLTEGSAYFANEHDFAQYQAKFKPPRKEESTCNKFGAMGYGRYTGQLSGMVGLTCSRHMFVIPGGLVDLLKGEGFAWGDYASLSGLQPWMNVLKLMCRGYDVNCQYDKKLDFRLAEFRKDFSHLKSIRYTHFPPTRSLIPKFHGAAHRLWCQIWRSYHYTPGVGMTDGEALERIWAGFNALAIRTREMSAGHRHDVINDYHNDMNIRRMHGMPKYLFDRLKKAEDQFATSSQHLAALEAYIEEKHKHKLPVWRKLEAEWEVNVLDPRKFEKAENPYLMHKNNGLTEKQLIAMVEKSKSTKSSSAHGSLGLIHRGIALAHEREAILDALEDEDTLDLTTLEPRCRKYVSDVEAWSVLSGSYIIPLVDEAVRLLETKDPASMSSKVSPFPLRKPRGDTGPAGKGFPPQRAPAGKSDLWLEVHDARVALPSSYDAAVLRESCMHELVQLEQQIRQAQARDILDELRTAIIGREAFKIKKVHAHNKKHTTRTVSQIRTMEESVRTTANQYRRTRLALVALGMSDSDDTFRPLRPQDVVKFTIDAQHRKLNESSETISWIWEKFNFTTAKPGSPYANFYADALRVHWFRCSALKKRWHEDVQLLKEEMARTVRFFGYYHREWTERSVQREQDLEPAAAAYARRQAHRYVRLLGLCQHHFKDKIDLEEKSLKACLDAVS